MPIYIGAGGGEGVGIGALKVDKLANGKYAGFSDLASLKNAYAAYRKPEEGFAAIVGTTTDNWTTVGTITVAYVWDPVANDWDSVVTNFKGEQGVKGETGSGFDWKGAYNNLTVYAVDDVVQWVNPTTDTIGLYVCIKGGERGNIPDRTTYWDDYIIAARPNTKKNPTFKAEARFSTSPSDTQHLSPNSQITSISVEWDIVEKSVHDEAITRVDLTFNTVTPSGVVNIQNSANKYTYAPTPAITQPKFNSEIVATLTITTNKGNTARFTHTMSWQINWLKGYLDQDANTLTVAQAQTLTSESGNDMPKSVRIQRIPNTNARVFLLVEEINHKTLPNNFHLDLFPYLHRVNGKILTIGGRDYQVYASTQKTHANDLTVTAAYS